MIEEDHAAKDSGRKLHSHADWDRATGGKWARGLPIVPGRMLKSATSNLFILFILHVCHYKSTNTIYNYTTMMSHKDYINISHKYYDGWNDHTEIKSPITGFHKVH